MDAETEAFEIQSLFFANPGIYHRLMTSRRIGSSGEEDSEARPDPARVPLSQGIPRIGSGRQVDLAFVCL
jgi:hypothetical protein